MTNDLQSEKLEVPNTTAADTAAVSTELEAPKWLVLALQILAYAIPLSFLAYVLYINYLPFGYNKTFTIDVGTEGDTDSSQQFYLEPSPDLSKRKTAEEGTTYRELNGIANVVFKPSVVLKDAEVTVSVEGEGVEIIPPVIDFDPNSVRWDYSWDFTQGKKPEELGLTGNAYPFDGAMYFDGTARLELASSSDKFEDGPFTVYVEWVPTNFEDDFQQIVGHYNWEILQNKNSISFQVGRMNNSTGTFYSIKKVIDTTYMGTKHNALAIYKPNSETSGTGYIELWIDGKYVNRVFINNDIIWDDYQFKSVGLSFGKSDHGISKLFHGYVNRANVSFDTFSLTNSQFKIENGITHIYISSNKNEAEVSTLKLHVNK